MTAARARRTAMTDQGIFNAFTSLNCGLSGDEAALNQPLLLLFMLGKYWNNAERLHLFRDVHQPFGTFLKEFLPPGKFNSESTLLPFWHMQNSPQVWTLVGLKTVKKPKDPKSRPRLTDALNSALLGGFTEQVYRRIINDKVMLLEIAFAVLYEYFPDKMHLPLLQAFGIPSMTARPSSAEQKILAQYHYSCSICEFPGTSNETSTDLQVVYIKPVAEAGQKPDNCITMCDMHSNLFGHGTIAIAEDDTILVSEQFKKFGGKENLLAYQSKRVSFPAKSSYQPNRDHLAWHRERIFKP